MIDNWTSALPDNHLSSSNIVFKKFNRLQLFIIASAEAVACKMCCIFLEDCVFWKAAFLGELLCHCWGTRVYRCCIDPQPSPGTPILTTWLLYPESAGYLRKERVSTRNGKVGKCCSWITTYHRSLLKLLF